MKMSESARDALTEVFNIGIGRAASALAEICGKEVAMSVPEVRLLDATEIDTLDLGEEERRHCIGVRMDFQGFIDASGVLVFAERGALDLIRLVTKEAKGHGALSDLEYEAISEVGNIMFNYWLGAIADLQQAEIISGLPQVEQGPYRRLLLDINLDSDKTPLLLVHVDLKVNDTAITGKFVIALRSPTLQAFVDQILGNYFGGSIPGDPDL